MQAAGHVCIFFPSLPLSPEPFLQLSSLTLSPWTLPPWPCSLPLLDTPGHHTLSSCRLPGSSSSTDPVFPGKIPCLSHSPPVDNASCIEDSHIPATPLFAASTTELTHVHPDSPSGQVALDLQASAPLNKELQGVGDNEPLSYISFCCSLSLSHV